MTIFNPKNNNLNKENNNADVDIAEADFDATKINWRFAFMIVNILYDTNLFLRLIPSEE